MKIHLFEGRTAGIRYGNWGKFGVAVPGPDEWAWRSQLDADDQDMHLVRLGGQRPLLHEVGWAREHIWVWDLQTGEGAVFRHGGHARADLNSHRIWVCPLFESFLVWLYRQDLNTLDDLPQVVELDAEFEMYGYRRPGMWFDRASGRLRVLPGPGVCVLP